MVLRSSALGRALITTAIVQVVLYPGCAPTGARGEGSVLPSIQLRDNVVRATFPGMGKGIWWSLHEWELR